MKIKGPADYSGPAATPPEPGKGGEEKISSGRQADRLLPQQTETAASAAATAGRGVRRQAGTFEVEMEGRARAMKTENLQGEAVAGRVVDSVLEDVLGKEFMSGPRADAIRQAIGPMVSQDENLMSRIHSILSRLENKK